MASVSKFASFLRTLIGRRQQPTRRYSHRPMLELLEDRLAPAVIIPATSAWKYLDNGSDQGSAWRAVSYADTAWATGNAQLGYGDGDEQTVVSYGPDSGNKYPTTYFRKSFTLADTYTTLNMAIQRDDGAVVYINGTEVFRSNMGSGAIAYNTYATSTASDDGATFIPATLSPGVLLLGTNVIAVEIHQRDAGSSDISFDLTLDGTPAGGGSTVVSIIATDSAAAESNNTGTFTISRTGSTSAALTVNLSPGGTAGAGDYVALPTFVTIPSGAASTTLTVTPIDDSTPESAETVIVSLSSGAQYTVGAPGSATVTIADNDSTATSVRFAAIGDYGAEGPDLADVANLVQSWSPDLIITMGDNNYSNGEAATIDANIGQYFHDYISPYLGSYGAGATINRFFPSLGNHDWGDVIDPNGADPYLDYFTLPGNERYYTFTWGPVQFFAIDSDVNEPDGRSSTSVQAQWLQSELAASSAPWKIVYFHEPPYSSSSNHGSTTIMQWPFKAWGATAVLAGHDHDYERLIVNDFPYFVNGLGGHETYGFGTPLPGSVVRYNADFGAQLVDATSTQITFMFIAVSGAVIDSFTLTNTSSNLPPSANAGGPYSVQEGASVTLSAAASVDPDGDPLTYSWDVNGDGAFGDASGVGPTLTWVQLQALGINDGPATRNVKVRVGDGQGNIVTSAAQTLSVTNKAPTATLGNSGPIIEGSSATVSFSAQADPSSADTTAGFRYSYDFDNNGTFETTNSTTASATVPASYLAGAGAHTVRGRIQDKDGGFTDYTTTVTVTTVAPPPTTLVAAGSIWKYKDNGSNQGTAWRSTSFNDSTWASGAAQLGYGDGDEQTVVSYGTNSSNVYITTYFRKTFAVPDASAYASLNLGLLRDDGAVVYLNGVEVFRNNMPSGTIGYRTRASTGISGTPETIFLQATLAPSVLVTGTNILAVEIHQNSVTSSDISFDLSLTGTLKTTSAAATSMASAAPATSTSTPLAAPMTMPSTTTTMSGGASVVDDSSNLLPVPDAKKAVRKGGVEILLK